LIITTEDGDPVDDVSGSTDELTATVGESGMLESEFEGIEVEGTKETAKS